MSDEPPLAAVVAKPEVDRAIAALREEGVYDDARKISEGGPETVELPVTEPPTETAVVEVVEATDPDLRAPGLADLLRERGWDEDDLDGVPRSWAVIGDIVLADFSDCPREGEVGEALLEIHGGADTVLAREGISGEHRKPDVRTVAGAGDTETVHTEHGTKYALDLAEVMFSPGNKAERRRMGDVVDDGERVFDMFAGIGYFALPMARAGAGVTATEINPTAFRYLLENAALNGVTDRIDAYRADCRDVETSADRVVMGYYDSHEYLNSALAALDGEGILHMHEATPEAELPDRPVSRIEDAAGRAGREVEILDRRIVKSHSAGVYHVVIDARVGRSD